MTTLTIHLPPPALLSANQRLHHYVYARMVRDIADATLMACPQHLVPRLGKAHVMASISWPDKRKRDVHNYYPTLKAMIDALVRHRGFLPDDSDEYLIGPDMRRGPRIEGALARITLTITDQGVPF